VLNRREGSRVTSRQPAPASQREGEQLHGSTRVSGIGILIEPPKPPLYSTNFVPTNGAKSCNKLFNKNHFN
jgi:hypothetical protein